MPETVTTKRKAGRPTNRSRIPFSDKQLDALHQKPVLVAKLSLFLDPTDLKDVNIAHDCITIANHKAAEFLEQLLKKELFDPTFVIGTATEKAKHAR